MTRLENALAAIGFQPVAKYDGDQQAMHVVALIKGAERYVFIFDAANIAELRRTICRFAANPELSFTWVDVAVVIQKLLET